MASSSLISMPESGAADEHGGEVLEQQGDGGRDVLGIEVRRVAMLLNMSHRGGDDVHAKSPKFVLNGGKPLLCGGELCDRDHDADVLLEHVPVAGDHRSEERIVLRGVRQVKAQSGRRQDVLQKRLGKCGEQILFVVKVPVEHRRGFTCRRGDVGQCGAVEASLGEQFSGGLLDGRPGLAAFCGQRRL